MEVSHAHVEKNASPGRSCSSSSQIIGYPEWLYLYLVYSIFGGALFVRDGLLVSIQ